MADRPPKPVPLRPQQVGHTPDAVTPPVRDRLDHTGVTWKPIGVEIPPTPVPQPGDFIGATIADFYLDELLGVGGMGAVYLARATTPAARKISHGEKVAMKILSPQLAADSEIRARFIREARAQAKLSHPNIVPVLAAGDSRQSPYIIMPYLDGGSVVDLLRRRNLLSEAKAIKIWKPLLLALDHAHTQGYVHRDIKAGNIMLDATGKPLLADFGLVGSLGGDDHDGARSGTHFPSRVAGLADLPSLDLSRLTVTEADSEFSNSNTPMIHLKTAPPGKCLLLGHTHT